MNANKQANINFSFLPPPPRFFFFPFQHPDVEGEDITVDAYVVVFSVTDPGTYNYAVNTVRKLRVESGIDRAIILVGNKIDLVRQRRVTKHGQFTLFASVRCFSVSCGDHVRLTGR